MDREAKTEHFGIIKFEQILFLIFLKISIMAEIFREIKNNNCPNLIKPKFSVFFTDSECVPFMDL